MKREIEKDLSDWKNNPLRKPLLVRGARQVGKSYTVTQFCRENFERVVTVNFDKVPEIHQFFAKELSPSRILRDLSLYYNTEVIEGRTIFFFDEIQECPRAIMALRYFYEEMPKLHIIGAGSLLEFVTHSEGFQMPVGRIDYLWMKAMSFGEFLEATGGEKLRRHLQDLTPKNPLSEPLHQKLLEKVKEYAGVGGMPALVDAFSKEASPKQIQELQESLLRTFRDDFGKYASRAHHKYLDKVFLTAPKMAGGKFKYSHVDPTLQSRDIKNALELLMEAGLFYKIKHTPAKGFPLESGSSEKKFKVIFFDIGLMQRLSGLSHEVFFSEDLAHLYRGGVAEQMVGQELLAYGSRRAEGQLYFWTREERGSSAEVDYLFPLEERIFPIEVKSKSPGRLKSLRLFMKEHSIPLGIRVSSLPFSYQDGILSVPFYALERLTFLIKANLN